MTITRQTADLDIPDLKFAGTHVLEEERLKLLGLTFDAKLTFACHLRKLATRATQRLAFLRKAASHLDHNGLLTMYKGFVRPVLEYSPLVWMGAAQSHLARLDRVQHRAMRIIGHHVLLPSLAMRRHVAGLTYMFKLHCLAGPERLVNLLPPPAPPPAQGPRNPG